MADLPDMPVAKRLRLEENGEVLFSDCSTCSLENIRKKQAKFCQDRNWDQYHSPRNVLLAMVGEVGEVAELFQWKGEVQQGLPDWSKEEKEQLSHELSDVLIYLVRLADRCNVDLPVAVMEKFELNAQKYPANVVYGSNKKYTKYSKKNKEISSAGNINESGDKKDVEQIQSNTSASETDGANPSDILKHVTSKKGSSSPKKSSPKKCLESNSKVGSSKKNLGKIQGDGSSCDSEENEQQIPNINKESVTSDKHSPPKKRKSGGKKLMKGNSDDDEYNKMCMENIQKDSSAAASEIISDEKAINSVVTTKLGNSTKKSERHTKSYWKKTNDKDAKKAASSGKRSGPQKKSDESFDNSFTLKVDVHNDQNGNLNQAVNSSESYNECMRNVSQSSGQLRVLIKKCDGYLENSNVSMGKLFESSNGGVKNDTSSTASRAKKRQSSLF